MSGLSSQLLGSFPGLVQHSILGSALSPLSYPASPMWIAVRQRFAQFHGNLLLTPLQGQDRLNKRNGVVNCLNRHYYGSASGTDNSFLIGSWGKVTAIRPPRDVDLYFLLPAAVYYRFKGHLWNRQ